MHTQKSTQRHYKLLFFGGALLSLSLSALFAWTGPASSAPNGNVSAPLNVSSVAQTKAGDLSVGGSITASVFCLGTDCITSWPSGGSSSNKKIFTPSNAGSFTVPSGVTSITVQVWGAGGGGGHGVRSYTYNGYRQETFGGGGGSGGYVASTIAVTPGQVFLVNPGTGGCAGALVVDPTIATQACTGQSSTFTTTGYVPLLLAGGGTGGVSHEAYINWGSYNGTAYCGGGYGVPAAGGNTYSAYPDFVTHSGADGLRCTQLPGNYEASTGQFWDHVGSCDENGCVTTLNTVYKPTTGGVAYASLDVPNAGNGGYGSSVDDTPTAGRNGAVVISW